MRVTRRVTPALEIEGLRALLRNITAPQPLEQLAWALDRARRYLAESPEALVAVDPRVQRWHSDDAQDEVHYFHGQTYLVGFNPRFYDEATQNALVALAWLNG